MIQDFRSRFGMMRDNDPTGQQQDDTVKERYPAQSHARNLVFVLQDGRRVFLNYSYLVCTEELPDTGSLLLHFTTHTVTLAGKGLDALFIDLVGHIPRIIACTEPRYDLLAEGQPVVHEITVAANA